MPLQRVRTGVNLNYEVSGDGEPLVLVIGTAQSIGLWGPFQESLARRYRVIALDNRGLGGSERGEGVITAASMAEDVSGLLEALEVPRAHVVGWSLGSAIVQELAMAHPEQVASVVLYATWGRSVGFQRSIGAALRFPYVHRDLASALTIGALAFSPEILDRPDLEAMVGSMVKGFPQTEAQMAVTVEQWDAGLAHDSLDRLGAVRAPTLVVSGEQDLLTLPVQNAAVAEAIAGARLELLTGPGSSHCLHVERPEDLAAVVLGFLNEQPPVGAPTR